MRRLPGWTLLLAGSLLGCPADAAPPVPEVDMGRPDSGPRDAALRDAPATDAPAADAPAMDAPSEDAGRDAGAADAGPVDAPAMDAGAPLPTLDGVLEEDEWEPFAEAAVNPEPTLWDGNELRRLMMFATSTHLYVAIDGRVEGTPAVEQNAIVLYLDTDLDDTTMGVPDPIDLADGAGLLDDALSAGYTTPANFRVDFAFGTRGVDTMVGIPGAEPEPEFDERIGWRDVATDPGDFQWVSGFEAPAVCGEDACETRIRWATLRAISGRTVALFVRITNGDGTAFDNAQTLPFDEPTLPTSAMAFATVVVP